MTVVPLVHYATNRGYGTFTRAESSREELEVLGHELEEFARTDAHMIAKMEVLDA